MYCEIKIVRWSIVLKREARIRLTYKRDHVPEVQQWRDFLIESEPIPSELLLLTRSIWAEEKS